MASPRAGYRGSLDEPAEKLPALVEGLVAGAERLEGLSAAQAGRFGGRPVVPGVALQQNYSGWRRFASFRRKTPEQQAAAPKRAKAEPESEEAKGKKVRGPGRGGGGFGLGLVLGLGRVSPGLGARPLGWDACQDSSSLRGSGAGVVDSSRAEQPCWSSHKLLLP